MDMVSHHFVGEFRERRSSIFMVSCPQVRGREQRFFFITRIIDEPGSLQETRVIMECNGLINRIRSDRDIDPGTVFFKVTEGMEVASRSAGDSGPWGSS
jgi:hypothetical protein